MNSKNKTKKVLCDGFERKLHHHRHRVSNMQDSNETRFLKLMDSSLEKKKKECIDIDTPFDLELAKILMSK